MAWSRIAMTFAFLCILPTLVSSIGTGALWWQIQVPVQQSATKTPSKPEEDVNDNDDDQAEATLSLTKLAERVRRLEHERPLSRADTIANWSTISDGMTPNHE